MVRPFSIDLALAGPLHDLGVDPQHLLRAAGLPADIFSRDRPTLEPQLFFQLWEALVAMVDAPAPGLAIGRAVRSDSFSPPLFACLCSPNLQVAMERLSLFKPLLGPCRLDLAKADGALQITYAAEGHLELPREYVAAELVFLLALARHATRAEIVPMRVDMVEVPKSELYERYFGIRVRQSDGDRLTFSARDVERPFFSVNPAMYSVFEPELRKRLEDIHSSVSLPEKLQAALMEVLPTGRTRVGDVASRLGLSERSLQRKLGEAGTSFQGELSALRARLATHYLRNTTHSSPEISYLLGYDDPNSFIRAFHGWTGSSPEAMRRSARH